MLTVVHYTADPDTLTEPILTALRPGCGALSS